MEFAGEVKMKGGTEVRVVEGLHEEHMHIHIHARDRHALGGIGSDRESPELIRHKVISQLRQFLNFFLLLKLFLKILTFY